MNKPQLRVVPPALTDRERSVNQELLARVKKALASAQEIRVPATDIRRYLDQPRLSFDDESLRRLSHAIDAGGQMTPGMIRKKIGDTRYEIVDEDGALQLREHPGKSHYELIDGERRWRSMLLIPEERRPLYKASVIDADDEVVQFLIAGAANFHREGHAPIEAMRTIDRYLGFGLNMEEIAALLGMSVMWASQLHGLKNLTPALQFLLDPKVPKKMRLPVTAAIQISKAAPRLQDDLANRVLNKEVSLGRLRGEVIKVAQRTGSYVRVREVSPGHQWESFENKVGVLERTVEDIAALVSKGYINHLLGSPKTADPVLRKLQGVREAILKLEARIRTKRE